MGSEDLEITRTGLEGWSVETENGLSVALDTELSTELVQEVAKALLPARAEITGDAKRDGGAAFLARLRSRLLGAMRERDLTPMERAQAATELIRKSSLPLYGGLGTDVNGIRAVMALADKSGGVVDHALSEGQYRNFRVLQTRGWITTTLTEARNRADVAGDGVLREAADPKILDHALPQWGHGDAPPCVAV